MSTRSKPLFERLDRAGLVQHVVRLITDAILQGRLRPGDRLTESGIARDLGLSRAPVREAARLLENRGLVVSQPNRGFFVREVTAEAIDSLYELRICIECAAVARLVAVGPEPALPGLRARIDEMHRLAEAEDPLAQIEADMAFHRLICEHSGNPRFVTVFDQIADETQLGLMLIGRLYDDPLRMAETHEPVIAAIAAHDAEAATAALEYHIGTARRIVTDIFRKLKEDSPA
ncbi:GntR family transcriptional regulator [Limimaricola pyoseonensis]|uniref:DNA-binding transcriptional regulator, GntR family n=1 Tax=Limimaricola pyoseonensis TaxID=521013 RepID=A0A1G7G0V0_9RHOB|nr:GntR family transcriptional regulator [Limimaricola pyoseonensis]SDE81655.1 DNA-binding transcriptional regulator, GntR family [Limimaricola pyoseonensis]